VEQRVGQRRWSRKTPRAVGKWLGDGWTIFPYEWKFGKGGLQGKVGRETSPSKVLKAEARGIVRGGGGGGKMTEGGGRRDT